MLSLSKGALILAFFFTASILGNILVANIYQNPSGNNEETPSFRSKFFFVCSSQNGITENNMVTENRLMKCNELASIPH